MGARSAPVSASDVLPLHVERRGAGAPLVLLHGGVGSWTHWVRNIDALAAHFEVFAVDLPGFGRSPDAERKASRERYLGQCVSALDAVVPPGGRFFLVGFSFGSVIGAHVAAAFGDRMARLSLLAPGGLRSIRSGDPRYRRMPPDGAPEAEIRATVRHNLLQLMLHDPVSVTDEAVGIHRENIRNTRFYSRRVSLRDCLLDDLRRVRCPIQVLLGEHDTVVYPSHERRFAHLRSAVPDFRLDMIPGAGHWMQYEQPEAVNRVLIEFLTAGD